MTVSKYTQPNYSTQTGTAYPLGLDAAFSVAARIAMEFSPNAQSSPNMTVQVNAGHIYNAVTVTLSEVIAQNTGTITAPVGNPRYDIVYIDRLTGAVGVATGTPAASPALPAIPSGKVPVASVLLQTSSTTITNSMITDIRDLGSMGLGQAAFYNVGETAGSIPLVETTRWNKAPVSQKAANFTITSAERGFVMEATADGVTFNMNATALGDGFIVGVRSNAVGRSITVGDTATTNNFYNPGNEAAETLSFTGRSTHWMEANGGSWWEVANPVLDIPGLAADATPATGDYIMTWDISANLYKKVLLSALATALGSGSLLGAQTFTSSGTYTKTAGTTRVLVFVVGGGGPGSGAGGGGGAGTAIKMVAGGITGVTVTVGASGASSSFGGYCSATGGAASPGFNQGGSPGVGSGGDLNFNGDPGGNADANWDGQGGGSFFGGGGLTAGNGYAYGGGGGGGGSALGASGVVFILEFA